MAEIQQVNIQCECPHHHGPLFLLKPWAWGRPCRRCERMMERNVVVVPTSGAAGVTVTPGMRTRASPIVVSTTQTVPVQQVQQVQQVVTTQQILPPAYNETLIVN